MHGSYCAHPLSSNPLQDVPLAVSAASMLGFESSISCELAMSIFPGQLPDYLKWLQFEATTTTTSATALRSSLAGVFGRWASGKPIHNKYLQASIDVTSINVHSGLVSRLVQLRQSFGHPQPVCTVRGFAGGLASSMWLLGTTYTSTPFHVDWGHAFNIAFSLQVRG